MQVLKRDKRPENSTGTEGIVLTLHDNGCIWSATAKHVNQSAVEVKDGCTSVDEVLVALSSRKRVVEVTLTTSFSCSDVGAHLLGHCVAGYDGTQQTLSLTLEGWTETFRASNEQTNDQIGIFFNGLSTDPDAETEEVNEALSFHWIPSKVWVALGSQH